MSSLTTDGKPDVMGPEDEKRAEIVLGNSESASRASLLLRGADGDCGKVLLSEADVLNVEKRETTVST